MLAGRSRDPWIYSVDELAELLNSSYIFPSNTRITVMQTKDSGQVTSAQQ